LFSDPVLFYFFSDAYSFKVFCCSLVDVFFV